VSKFAYVALSCAAMSLVVSASAMAQDAAAMTPGGDVTADEATPLPPVVVEAPTQPILAKQKKPKSVGSAGNASAPTAPSQAPAIAAEGPGSGTGTAGVGVFTLGQIDMIGGSTVTNEAMWTFNKNTLDQAVAIVPGVTMTNTGGSRNERDILVRGFDRFRVPLSVDGVRVYLPADNRLDFNRFLTPDLSEIQIAKGYVSVLNGPGGMGGAINLVSRKPTKEVELEGRVGTVFSGDLDSMNSWSTYAYAGTRQKGYYAQLSGTMLDQDHWNLSNDFTPISLANENGGERGHSNTEDWRINTKVGLTPNATDEYSINYTVQQGEKSAPLHEAGQRVQGPRYWDWPYWDTSSVSWLSKTQIGSDSYFKSNVYYNTFKNLLSSYTDATYTIQNRNSQDFNSYYEDYAYGGFIEAGTNLIPMNTLKGAIHYRRDGHSERSDIAPTNSNPATQVHEPWQDSVVDTWSFALENTFHATRYFDIVTGASYDMDSVQEAQEFNSTTRRLVANPEPSTNAWNGQAAAIYSYSNTGKVHADVSSRTRFPTLFDRYSTRFDTRVANPNIQPERATNYEVGISDTIGRTVHASAAVFYSDLQDSIQNVFVAASGGSSVLGINADGKYHGFELSADWDITPGLRLGGNYTYLERDLDFAAAAAALPLGGTITQTTRNAVAAAEAEGTPRHEAFVYLNWQATRQLSFTPSIEIASDRSSLVTGPTSTLLLATPRPSYVKIGSYALVNLEAAYAFTDGITLNVGAANLLDEDYALAEGFPEPGRTFFANMRARY
jgi:iron complex outermembrane recepter protein